MWLSLDEGFAGREQEKKRSREFMVSLYYLPSLCGTWNQIVWVSELGSFYTFIEEDGGEAKRELGVVLKDHFHLNHSAGETITSLNIIYCRSLPKRREQYYLFWIPV